MNGLQTIPATTTTLFEITGHSQGYLKPIANNVYIGYSSTTDSSDGFLLTAGTDYIIQFGDKLYIYAGSETDVNYFMFS